MTRPTNTPGATLADVLPATNKYWFQQPHLLRLNLILLVPLLSPSTFGYDGKKARSTLLCLTDPTRIFHLGSLMNGLQSLRQWQEYFDNPTGSLLGTILAAQSIGSVIALPFLGTLCDKYGRKPILLSGIVIIGIAAAIQCASVNLPIFLSWRVF